MFVVVVFSLKITKYRNCSYPNMVCFQLINHRTPYTYYIYAVAAVKKWGFCIELQGGSLRTFFFAKELTVVKCVIVKEILTFYLLNQVKKYFHSKNLTPFFMSLKKCSPLQKFLTASTICHIFTSFHSGWGVHYFK